ncbi:hypothetical protein HanRHA438_Chr14g0633301 [Helianthus annuus]|nr:hypothetical protein HanRHA438_Chr14g0633301 [Helianthus annuus]
MFHHLFSGLPGKQLLYMFHHLIIFLNQDMDLIYFSLAKKINIFFMGNQAFLYNNNILTVKNKTKDK